jgi:hypothetical protein
MLGLCSLVILILLGALWADERNDLKYIQTAIGKEFTPTFQGEGQIFTLHGKMYIKCGDKVYICKD